VIARTRTDRPLAALAVAAAAALAAAAPGTALAATNEQNAATPGAPTTSTALAAGPAASPLGTAVGAAATTQNKGGGTSISTGVAIIAAVAALLTLGAVGWALARRFAYEPRWWLGLRHSFAEASFRTSATWAELRDWARIGR
jgi:hypothetical protein